METALQIFILINVFLMGMLALFGFQHFRAHRETAKPAAKSAVEPNRLPPAIKERMLQTAQAEFEASVSRSTGQLTRELDETGARLSKQYEKLGGSIIGDETARYKEVLARLRTQAEVGISSLSLELEEHRSQLKTEAATQVEAEKQRLVAQLDTRLGDAVGSFLTEALQYEVDLGSQTPYLLKTLEDHKAELKREISGEN